MSSASFDWGQGRVRRFAAKELREILRDRRTILTLFLMPLLLYPLLTIAFQQFFLSNLSTQKEPAYRVGVLVEEDYEALAGWLRRFNNDPASQVMLSPGTDRKALKIPRLEVFQSVDLQADLQIGNIDVGMRMQPKEIVVPGRARPVRIHEVEIVAMEDRPTGLDAARALREIISIANGIRAREQWTAVTGQPQFFPLAMRLTTLPPVQQRSTGMLTTLIPLILLLMTITGAVYPAIDLTAGERERGTLEVLMAAPIPRVGLLMAKYVAVLTVALLTAIVNLGMMTLTLSVSGLGSLLFGETGLTLRLVLQVLALLLLFAMFFSAVLLALTSFARSFKEAQAYLIPLMLLSLAPGMLALLPGLKLEGSLSVTPLVNVVLLARDLFEGTATALAAVTVVISTLLYASVAIAVAAQLFGAEAVLFNESGSWSDWLRRPRYASETLSLPRALLTLALLFPAHFLLSNGLATAEGLSLLPKIVAMALVNVVTFAGFPMFALIWSRVRWRSALALRRGPWLGMGGAIVLGLSLWPIVAEFSVLLRQLGLAQTSIELANRIRMLIEQWRGPGVLLIVLLLGVVPAVVEEVFFRGFLFSALRPTQAPRRTIVVTALLFGLFHVLTTHALAWERFLLTTLLGLVLGWVRWRTGGIFAGMSLHALHNAILLALAILPQGTALFGWTGAADQHLPAELLAVAAGGTLLGLALLSRGRPCAETSDSFTRADSAEENGSSQIEDNGSP